MRTLFIALFIALALLFLHVGAAHAQLKVYVWPAKFEVVAPAGSTTTRKVKVVNTGKTPLTVRAYTADWWYSASTPKRFAPAGTFPRSAASWISLPASEFDLDAGAERDVEYTLSVPRHSEGGHYAVVFFEVRPPPRAEDQGMALRLGGRIGVLIAQLDPHTSKAKLEVKEITVQPPTDVDPLALTVTVHNPGNVHVAPDATATVIVRATGKLVGTFALESRPQYLPGQTGELTGEWSQALPAGEYDILTTIAYHGAQAKVARTQLTVP